MLPIPIPLDQEPRGQSPRAGPLSPYLCSQKEAGASTQSPQLHGHEAGVHWGSCLHTGSTPTLPLVSCLAQAPLFIPGCKTADSQIRSLEPVGCLFNFLMCRHHLKVRNYLQCGFLPSFGKRAGPATPGPGCQLELPLYKDGTSTPHLAPPPGSCRCSHPMWLARGRLSVSSLSLTAELAHPLGFTAAHRLRRAITGQAFRPLSLEAPSCLFSPS